MKPDTGTDRGSAWLPKACWQSLGFRPQRNPKKKLHWHLCQHWHTKIIKSVRWVWQYNFRLVSITIGPGCLDTSLMLRAFTNSKKRQGRTVPGPSLKCEALIFLWVPVGFTQIVTGTGWRRPIGCLRLQVIFRKRATKYRALLWKMTYKDKASHGSSPPCTLHANESNEDFISCPQTWIWPSYSISGVSILSMMASRFLVPRQHWDWVYSLHRRWTVQL